MIFCLTTRWNAGAHTSGEALVDEIRGMGFTHLELGYDLRIDLVPGVQQRVKEGAVRVESVHNYCPVPVGAPRGHPELFTFADPDARVRASAVHYTTKTIRFAAEVGAKVVIAHGGHTDMPQMSQELCGLFEKGEQFGESYEKIKLKLQLTRDRKAKKQVEYLRQCLEQLAPALDETKVKLALENLPTWEAIPSEMEIETLCKEFGPRIGYWHDVGHGQVRQNLGFINQERWLERLQPYVLGMHVHDVAPPAFDHLMPPEGQVDFARLKRFAAGNILRVIEPSPGTPKEKVIEGLKVLRQAWQK